MRYASALLGSFAVYLGHGRGWAGSASTLAEATAMAVEKNALFVLENCTARVVWENPSRKEEMIQS